MPKKFISIEEATKEEKKRKALDLVDRLAKQEKMSWGIIIGVAFAFLFSIGVIVVDYILANKNLSDLQNQYFQEIKGVRDLNFQTELRLQKEIDELKNNIEQNKLCKPQP